MTVKLEDLKIGDKVMIEAEVLNINKDPNLNFPVTIIYGNNKLDLIDNNIISHIITEPEYKIGEEYLFYSIPQDADFARCGTLIAYYPDRTFPFFVANPKTWSEACYPIALDNFKHCKPIPKDDDKNCDGKEVEIDGKTYILKIKE